MKKKRENWKILKQTSRVNFDEIKLLHYLQTKSDPGRRTTDSHHTLNSKLDIISAVILVQVEMFSDIVCEANCSKLCSRWTHNGEFSDDVFHEVFHQVEIIGMICANARRVIEQKHNVGVNITKSVPWREIEKHTRIITTKMMKKYHTDRNMCSFKSELERGTSNKKWRC